MQMVRVTDKTFYFDCPSIIGLYLLNNQECCLIDSGEKIEQAEEIESVLRERGYRVSAIVTTHFHPDHCYGHSWWQAKSGCTIYASSFDAALLENPEISPYSLYTAVPLPVLKNRFLLAPRCQVTHRIEAGPQVIGGQVFTAVDLGGHTPGHLGWVTPDGVLFAGDALLAPSVLDASKLNYTADVYQHIHSLDNLRQIPSQWVIASHGGILDPIDEAISVNLQAMENIISTIRRYLSPGGASLEDILAQLIVDWGLPLNHSQYYLYRATVSAYLAYLYQQREIRIHLNEGRMLFIRRS